MLAAAIAQTWLACADDVVGVTRVAVPSNDVAADAVETGVREVELRDRMAATTLTSIQSHIRQILAII